MKHYILVGASSQMALATTKLLKNDSSFVYGISTHENLDSCDQLFTIESYKKENFPSIETAIDGLVYFPGTINLKPFGSLKESDFVQDWQINTMGAVAAIQAYLPNLKMSATASIVMMSTVAVQCGMPYHSSIAMAKGAIEGLTRALAAEFAPKIRVNCVAPSLSDTPLAQKFINTPEKIEQMEKRNPMRRLGKAEDIAETIHWLLSEKSSWITGQVLAVDGGMGILKV